MLIKFKGTKDIERKGYKLVSIEGVRVDTGEPWDRAFFKNQTAILEAVQDFEPDDYMNVKMVKNGKNWNIDSVVRPDADYVERVKNEGSSKKPTHTTTTKSETGGSNYKWNGRTGEAYDRSAAVYLAFEVMKHNAATETKKESKIIKPNELFEVADMINKYIHDGIKITDVGIEDIQLPEV